MNKVDFKKFIIKVISIMLIFTIGIVILVNFEKNIINSEINTKINAIVSALQEKYPLVTETEIMAILTRDTASSNILLKYGYSLKDTLVNNNLVIRFIIIDIVILSLGMVLILISFFKYEKRKNNDIQKITKLLNKINNGNYDLELDSFTEDELSILKSEIYKTTIKLKEQALNSMHDKQNLKTSLEDISHQLKTPLTSITIMLDNLLDEEHNKQKKEFLHDIKREITKLNFLIQNLLKLSKFDANTIVFESQEVDVSSLINAACENLATLSDLKEIKIQVKGPKGVQLKCDFSWQVEALTNIIKNCLEHSPKDGKIEISYGANNVYVWLKIKDYGSGISPKDLPHIFERFYRGEDASRDSIGIGLSLAKTIINHDGGVVSVASHHGTTFTIKYYQ